MANPNLVAVLLTGAEAWNEFRTAVGAEAPDLSNADLKSANLAGADLTSANLFRANLTGANLTGANLMLANLTFANLSEADLSNANLSMATLMLANLRDANLRGSDLSAVNLIGTHLRGVDVSGAKTESTIWADIDLRQVKGLDTIQHLGPSTIGIDAIYKSMGNIPRAFLSGSGVPDRFIVELKPLVDATESIQFHSCFISYSNKDKEFVDRLHADLARHGVKSFLASKDLKIGDKFRSRIEESIHRHDKLLLVLSEASIASHWVEDEVESAFTRERAGRTNVLFPIAIDNTFLNTDIAWAVHLRNKTHIGEFSRWSEIEFYKTAFQRLMRDLKVDDVRVANTNLG